MTAHSFQETYGRAFDKLYAEIESYPTDAGLWSVPAGISNSGGNLCLHLIGNVNHFIGALLGHTGYVRHREHEFSDKNVPRQTLLLNLLETKAMAGRVLGHLTEADLHKTFPVELSVGPQSTEYMLVFFAIHFEYHLGQINYHRRLTQP